MGMDAAKTFEWRPEDVKGLQGNYVDEVSSRWMYLALAACDKHAHHRALLEELAVYEERHAVSWKKILTSLGAEVPADQRLFEHQVYVGLAHFMGVDAIIPLLHKGEVEGIAKYKDQALRWKDARAQAALKEILPDEVSHEIELFGKMQESGPKTGILRSTILGANDGLGSTLALVSGVAGATQANQAVIIAGTAGLIAGAVSMAASNYISVKAEQEVFESQARLQREGIQFSLESKKAQLRKAYLVKGFTPAEANTVTERLAKQPEEFVKALLAEQDGLGASSFDQPLVLAAYTGFAFAVVGLVPILPYLFMPAGVAIEASLAFTCLALFTAGALRSLSTMQPFIRSGLEMLFIGLGAATVTYLVGMWLGAVVG